MWQQMKAAMVHLVIDNGPQRRLVRCAFRINTEFLRNTVAHLGGHQAICSELAANNRNNSVHSISCLVIEQRKAAADLAAFRCLRGVKRIQRSNPAEDT